MAVVDQSEGTNTLLLQFFTEMLNVQKIYILQLIIISNYFHTLQVTFIFINSSLLFYFIHFFIFNYLVFPSFVAVKCAKYFECHFF